MTATTVRPIPSPAPHLAERPANFKDPAYQAFWLLRIGFTVAPILFGIDKFAHVLVDWDKYLHHQSRSTRRCPGAPDVG